MISPCALSASGASEPTGSSGDIRPSVIARPKIIAVTDFAIDQLEYREWRFWSASLSSPTRQPPR